MADLAFLGLIGAFFALALLLVRGCDRIIGSDEQTAPLPATPSAPERDLAA
jgi:hypothetical protein